MSKTKPTYCETKFGILSVREIEAMITDGVANVNAFLLRELHHKLPISSFIGIRRTDFATAMKKATVSHDFNFLIKLINKSIS